MARILALPLLAASGLGATARITMVVEEVITLPVLARNNTTPSLACTCLVATGPETIAFLLPPTLAAQRPPTAGLQLSRSLLGNHRIPLVFD